MLRRCFDHVLHSLRRTFIKFNKYISYVQLDAVRKRSLKSNQSRYCMTPLQPVNEIWVAQKAKCGGFCSWNTNKNAATVTEQQPCPFLFTLFVGLVNDASSQPNSETGQAVWIVHVGLPQNFGFMAANEEQDPLLMHILKERTLKFVSVLSFYQYVRNQEENPHQKCHQCCCSASSKMNIDLFCHKGSRRALLCYCDQRS